MAAEEKFEIIKEKKEYKMTKSDKQNGKSICSKNLDSACKTNFDHYELKMTNAYID